MNIKEIKKEMSVFRDSFDSDLIAYDDSLKTKKELAEVINTQIRHNQDRQNEDQRELERFAERIGLDLL